MEIIRKELSEQEGLPPGTRYDPECDCIQTTVDGGATWTDNPGADPRKNTGYQMPPPDVPDIPCGAAAGLVAHIRASVDGAIDLTDNIALGNVLLGLVLPFFPISLFATLVIAVADALIFIGGSVLDGAFTEENYDTMRCIFRDNMDADGAIDDAAWSDILSDIDTQIGDAVVYNVLELLYSPLGSVGFTNAAAAHADPEADCDDCDGCIIDDFSEDDGGWDVIPPGSWAGGEYSGGAWRVTDSGSGNSRDVYIGKSFPFTTITSVKIEYTYSAGEHDTGSGVFSLEVGASTPINVNAPTAAPSSPVEWSGSIAESTVAVFVACSRCDGACGSLSGDATITKITVCGS